VNRGLSSPRNRNLSAVAVAIALITGCWLLLRDSDTVREPPPRLEDVRSPAEPIPGSPERRVIETALFEDDTEPLDEPTASRPEAPEPTTEPIVRDLRLQVIEGDTGKLIEGALVHVDRGGQSGESPPTDAHGRTLIKDLRRTGRLRVRATAEGYYDDDATAAQGASEVLIRMSPVMTYRWQILPGSGPVPPDGSGIEATPISHEALEIKRLSIRNGEVVAEDVLNKRLNALVTLEDGRVGHIAGWIGQALPPTVAFWQPRTLTVRVQDQEGRPQDGSGLRLAIAAAPRIFPLKQVAKMDEGGTAIIRNLPGTLVEVVGPETVVVDLTAGDADIVLTEPRIVTCVVRVRVDGKPGLPEGLRVFSHDLSLEPGIDKSEDGTHAVVGIRSTRSRGTLIVEAPGIRTLRIPVTLDQDPIVVDANLRRAATLRARALVSADTTYRLELRTKREPNAEWSFHCIGVPDPDVEDTWLFRDLPPGTYRLHDMRSMTRTEPMSIGETDVETVIDLTGIYMLHGTIEVPDPRDLARVTLQVEETDPLEGERPPRMSFAVASDGSFSVRLPAGKRMALEASHPLLRPDPVSGSVTVFGPTGPITLQLIRTPLIRFRIPLFYTANLPAVYVRPGPEGTGQAIMAKAWQDGETVVFSVPAAGPHTLTIDAWQDAPRILDVICPQDGLDLGLVTFEKGSSIRFVLRTLPDWRPQSYTALARRTDGPEHPRSAASGGQRTWDLDGLLPGRYRVTVGTSFGAPLFKDDAFEIDAATTPTVTIVVPPR
jgi:hypothetical protein